jgi:hypothetical protein
MAELLLASFITEVVISVEYTEVDPVWFDGA